MREVFQRLERLSTPYYLTGSEALARYGQPRQTMDLDVVMDLTPRDFPSVARAFEHDFLVNEPLSIGGRWMASLISSSTLGKVDLFVGRDDPWARAAMDRRQHWDHPAYGPIWVVTLEDLILAKLEWSGGTSELQTRDCRNLIVADRERIDWSYLEGWAGQLGVDRLLESVRDAA